MIVYPYHLNVAGSNRKTDANPVSISASSQDHSDNSASNRDSVALHLFCFHGISGSETSVDTTTLSRVSVPVRSVARAGRAVVRPILSRSYDSCKVFGTVAIRHA